MTRARSVLLVAAVLAGSVPAPLALSAAAEPVVDLVAVTGGDSALWTTTSDDLTWTSLGGRLAGAPAVVVGAEQVLFFGAGADRNVWVRSATQGWAPFGPAGTDCAEPSAAVSATTLAVGCRGADGALWVATVPDPPSGLPSTTSWRSLGGQLAHGVAVADAADAGTGARIAYTVVGTDARIWTRRSTTPWEVLSPAQRPFETGCTHAVGTDELFSVAACMTVNRVHAFLPDDPSAAVPLGGEILGRPAPVSGPGDGTRLWVVGRDQGVWVSVDGAEYVPVGGVAQPGGIAAVALSP